MLTGRDEAEILAAWAAHEESVRTATPGSPVYTPAPYPRDRAELLAAFRYFLHQIVAGPETRNERAVALAALEKAGKLSVEPLIVENWRPTRCSPHRRADRLHLLRLFETANRIERGRMVLHESGLWANLQLRPTDEHRGKRWQEELLLPSELAAASRRLGLSQAPTGPIHLMTADGLGGCQPTTPCLAFTAGTDRYLLRGGGELYRVTGPGRSLVDERGSAIELPALAPGDSVLVGVRRLPVERIGAH